MSDFQGMFERLTERHNKILEDLERTAEERDAARENARNAVQERDAALVKLAKVAAFIQAHPASFEVAPFSMLKEITKVCPACATLGRISRSPCTHLGMAD